MPHKDLRFRILFRAGAAIRLRGSSPFLLVYIMPWCRSLVVLAFTVALAAADDLRTLDNRMISGTVVQMSDKEIAIKTADGIVKTHLEDVLALDLRPIAGVPAQTSYSDIRLVDDTTLMCGSYAIKGKTVETTLLSGQRISLPLASVVSILRGAEDAKLRRAFSALTGNKVKRDRVVIYKGGEVNDLAGTLGDADAEGKKIKFRPVDGSELDVPIANLQGMIFYRPAGGSDGGVGGAEPICMVYDTVGNALAATKITSDGTKVTIDTTIPKVKLEYEAATIARFDFNMGKLTWLSDLVPTKVLEKSAVGLVVAYRKDVNLDGEPIVLDRSYAKGLSMHAHTELEYDLKAKYKKFTAVLGVDTRVGTDSQPKVVIEVDGRTSVFSEVINAKAVVPVSLDVTGANTIRIIVMSRNFLDLHDHVTLANPKVTQ